MIMQYAAVLYALLLLHLSICACVGTEPCLSVGAWQSTMDVLQQVGSSAVSLGQFQHAIGPFANITTLTYTNGSDPISGFRLLKRVQPEVAAYARVLCTASQDDL